MENVTITELASGIFKIVPNHGYVLWNKLTNTYFTEAVTKNVSEFEAVEKGI